MSTAFATEVRYTPEDLLAMPDGKRYELINGRLVERRMGAESSWVGTRLTSRLDRFCEDNRLGIVWAADNGYQCFAHAPGLVRRPDVSFVKTGRLPGDIAPKGWVKIPPDLAVEIISPNDSAEGLEEKLDDYRTAGVPLIWVIYPELRKVKIFRNGGSAGELREDDVLMSSLAFTAPCVRFCRVARRPMSRAPRPPARTAPVRPEPEGKTGHS